jgi:drug/metabolite transporter (DMT)-like permease
MLNALSPTTLAYTALAMLAFAANSLLCRLALSEPVIDPASFTTIRLVSGAIALTLLVYIPRTSSVRPSQAFADLAKAGSWLAAAALFGYAIAFSFAYLSLNASTGALILFSAVQCTMIGTGIARREYLAPLQIVGAIVAFAGLLYLLAPGLDAPDPVGAMLMGLAGIAWGIYSLKGRSATRRAFDPTTVTAGNFLKSVPFAVALILLYALWLELSVLGVLLAVVSGAITSGLGYAIWYTALKGLAGSEAAIVQLTVPVIAALGGIALLDEPLSLRLVLASVAILGGVALVLTARRGTPKPQ